MLRRRREQRGAAAVEFALVMLPMLYLIFGIIQYGLYFYASNAATQATSAAVRRLTVGDCQNTTQLKAYIKNRLGGAVTGPVAFTTTSGAPATGPSYSKVDGTADSGPGSVGGQVTLSIKVSAINMHFPFIPLPSSGQVHRTVDGRIEDTVATGGACT